MKKIMAFDELKFAGIVLYRPFKAGIYHSANTRHCL
jgi:hypothetical protein